MELVSVLAICAAAVATLMVAIWLISLLRRDVSIVDIFWGLGFVLVGWTAWLTTRPTNPAAWLLVIMVSLWGIRLAGYLAWRNWGQPEDYRYRAMRERHGARFPWVSLVTVFGLQGAIMWVVSLPIQVGISQASTWSVWCAVGAALWLLGFGFESIGDFQLARFKADPANEGQVMDRGLWRYTRHPNYFGDFVVWWGLFLIAIGSSFAWWTMVGPLLMSFLLIRVSGVRLLEKSLKDRKPGYAEYVRRTSAFVPLPPKPSQAGSGD